MHCKYLYFDSSQDIFDLLVIPISRHSLILKNGNIFCDEITFCSVVTILLLLIMINSRC